MSIFAPYTSGELTQAFPVTTTALLQSTCRKIDDLIQAGVISDHELHQLLPLVGTAIDAHLEATQVASAAYSGTAGTLQRNYYAIPVYPLPTGTASNTAGVFINQLTSAPGGGRNNTKNFVASNDMQRGFIGGSAAHPPAAVVVADTAAELDQSNYVTIVAPPANASKVTGITFDIFASFSEVVSGVTTVTTYLVKKSAAPGSTVIDSNQVFQAYALPAHAHASVDTTVNPAIPIIGPRTVLAAN